MKGLAARLAIALLLAGMLAGPAHATEAPPLPKPAPKMLEARHDAAEFRILTFNVQFLNRSYGAFDSYLETVRPDVVVLQEARKASGLVNGDCSTQMWGRQQRSSQFRHRSSAAWPITRRSVRVRVIQARGHCVFLR